MINPFIKMQVKDIIRQLPKELPFDHPDFFTTYELMIYTNQEDGDWDLEDFSHFKGMRELDKVIKKIDNQYGDRLNHIDFKWSEEEGEFDQITIYVRPVKR